MRSRSPWNSLASFAAVLFTFIGLSLTSGSGASASTPFVPEVVASTGDVGSYCSLALDAQGNPRISYFDATNFVLKYASKNGVGPWTIETADGSSGHVGRYSSLALDSQGNPCIAYNDAHIGYLKYAHKVGGTWTIETADPGPTDYVGYYCSLVLDAQDNPHIAYYDSTAKNLRLAVKSGGVWNVQTYYSNVGDNGRYCSLALAHNGDPVISFYDLTDKKLQVYAKTYSGLSSLTLESNADDVGQYSSLAMDNQEHYGIAYMDATSFVPKYYTNTGPTYTPEAIGPGGGLNMNLRFDASGVAHVVYINNGLVYATRLSPGNWSTEYAVGSATLYSATYPSLALDAQGTPHIAFYSGIGGDLIYADAAVHVASPAAGATWPVGSQRSVLWKGEGPVDVQLSTDGGTSWQTLVSHTQADSVPIRVPHSPTRFARIQVVRDSPPSSAVSDSFFTISTNIALLGLKVQPLPGAGNRVEWTTDPGPADLGGYRLFRADATGAAFTPVGPALITGTVYEDRGAPAGAQYRLSAVNGLGEEFVLGSSSGGMALLHAVEISPALYRAGEVRIGYLVPASLGSAVSVRVQVLDVAGRVVRDLYSGNVAPASIQQLSWDGKTMAGETLSSGLYFVRVSAPGAGYQASARMMVVR